MQQISVCNLSYAVFFACMISLVPTSFAASGDVVEIKHGQLLAQTCAACHGADGNTANAALYPNLAGQFPDYIVLQLTNFKSGERPNGLMRTFANSLQQSDMQAVGAYFGAQKAKPQPSVDKTVEGKGRLIFTRGSAAGAPACVTCHGQRGHGQGAFPRVASQPMQYTLEQLHVYRDAEKFNNPLASEMKTIALKVNEEEMRAVSAYLATLP